MTMALGPLSPASGPPAAWNRKHLLGLEDLSREEIVGILDTAESFAEISHPEPQEGPRAARAGSSSTCSSRTRPGPGPASAWRPSGSRPTRRTSPPASPACPRARRSSTRPRTSRRWGPTSMVVRHPTPGAPPAGAARRGLDHQRRRRRPRAPDAGPARPPDDPPRQGADRGPDRRPGRRHRPLARRPVEHLGPDQARRAGDPLRPADAGPPGHGTARLRGRLPPRRHPAALRRRQRPADPVRAAAEGPLPLGRRILPASTG